MPASPTQSDERSTQDATPLYIDGTYLTKNAGWHVEDSPWKADQIRTILAKNRISPSTVSEVGCGAGEILRQLSISMPNTRCTGFELSPQAFALCKERASERLDYRNDDILQKNESFDVLLCIDVFEHVEDYLGFLKSLRSKAIYKIFHIPLDISMLSIANNSMMNARRAVGHLHYFTRDTAIATLRDCGYDIIDASYTRPFSGLASPTMKAKIAKLPRKLLYAISPDWMAKLLGGCSLIVLAK